MDNQNTGWENFKEETKILERRSFLVRKVRELSNKELYDLAATNVALLNPPFKNEYKLISSNRSKINKADIIECPVCLSEPATEYICKNGHVCCKSCIPDLYQHFNSCSICRSDLLPCIPYGATNKVFYLKL